MQGRGPRKGWGGGGAWGCGRAGNGGCDGGGGREGEVEGGTAMVQNFVPSIGIRWHDLYNAGMERKLTTMNISMPRTMRKYVESRINKGGFANASEYIRHLIRAEAAVEKGQRERLEALLQEGIDSGPAVAMTRKDWDDIRKKGLERAKELKAARRKAS
jgi:antitoxin ParD1/3/4